MLTDHRITINNKSARYYLVNNLINNVTNHITSQDDNNSKPHAHFYGGNGFAVGVYEPLLMNLSKNFTINSLAMRGYWYDKPKVATCEKVLTREQDANVLIDFLDATKESRQGEKVIGIGHSQGATASALAAAKRPDLFQALYLIEPVTFTKGQTILYNLIPNIIKMNHEPFKSTLKKQSQWANIDEYYQYLRLHRAYKRVSDEHLLIYAKNSLIECSERKAHELLFSPEQELANYFGTPFIDNALKTLDKANLPYYIIQGKPSMFINNKVRKNWKKFVPKHNITSLPEYGHLLPIEAPGLVADNIINHHVKKH